VGLASTRTRGNLATVVLGQLDDDVEPLLGTDRFGQGREDRANMPGSLVERPASSKSAPSRAATRCKNVASGMRRAPGPADDLPRRSGGCSSV